VDPELVAHRYPFLIELSSILGALAGIGAGFLLFARQPVVPSPSLRALVNVEATTTTLASVGDDIPAKIVTQELLDGAFKAKLDWTVPDTTRVLLVPHHLVAAREIASLLSATQKPSVVYLISPDHFSKGKTVFTTTDRGFVSPFGRVPNEPDLVAGLVSDVPKLRNNALPFAAEHGVTGLIPFITTAWPDVPVVPIIVRIDAKTSDRVSLAKALEDRLRQDPNALLLSTVDFSHYQPSSVADLHDKLAQDVVTSLADLEADRVEIDSPGTLGVALKVSRDLGLGDVTIHAHTNSIRLLQATVDTQSTSHLLVSFAPGPIKKQTVTTALFVGDMMFDRTVATRIAASKDSAYTFQKIHGEEDRFFKGYDLVVGNLEGPVTPQHRPPEKAIDFAFNKTIPGLLKKEGFDAVSQANNHTLDQGRIGADDSRSTLQASGLSAFGDEIRDDATSSIAILERRGQKIALLGFNTTDHALDETAVLASIKQARSSADRVIVYMHWGQEYAAKPTSAQVARAHWFIDHGVDAVIGSHPHWMESVETYHGHVIAYSLGNFIFDQDWSPETQEGLAVGLVLDGTSSELHLFPVSIIKSQPELLSGTARDARLKHLADVSDSALREQILKGVITVSP